MGHGNNPAGDAGDPERDSIHKLQRAQQVEHRRFVSVRGFNLSFRMQFNQQNRLSVFGTVGAQPSTSRSLYIWFPWKALSRSILLSPKEFCQSTTMARLTIHLLLSNLYQVWLSLIDISESLYTVPCFRFSLLYLEWILIFLINFYGFDHLYNVLSSIRTCHGCLYMQFKY